MTSSNSIRLCQLTMVFLTAIDDQNCSASCPFCSESVCQVNGFHYAMRLTSMRSRVYLLWQNRIIQGEPLLWYFEPEPISYSGGAASGNGIDNLVQRPMVHRDRHTSLALLGDYQQP